MPIMSAVVSQAEAFVSGKQISDAEFLDCQAVKNVEKSNQAAIRLGCVRPLKTYRSCREMIWWQVVDSVQP